jgi:dephospho-CoA kinase
MPKLLVGLTGGIGAGKSVALTAFRRAGAGTVSLDKVAHDLSAKGKSMHRAIRRAFGTSVFDSRGELDRAALAGRVFRTPAQRRRLEKATHPLIRKEMVRRLRAIKQPVAVVDVPLLFENDLHKEFDVTVLVLANREKRIRRVRRRDGASRAEVLRRIQAQMPTAKKRDLADIEISNDGTPAQLSRSVAEFQRAFHLIAASRNLKRNP